MLLGIRGDGKNQEEERGPCLGSFEISLRGNKEGSGGENSRVEDKARGCGEHWGEFWRSTESET